MRKLSLNNTHILRMSSPLWTTIPASASAQATTNPLRSIVDEITPDPNHPKSFLKLSIGDPTLDGNLLPPPIATTAIQEALVSHKWDGYAVAPGHPEARRAVADFWNENFVSANTARASKKFSFEDVILTSGGSHALEMSMAALCNPGDILLLPSPGFCLYNTLCSNKNITAVHYKCIAEKKWEIDLEALEKTIVEYKTAGKQQIKGMIVNNPGNPAGSNFSAEHVKDICALAAKYFLPIIADEIYAGIVYPSDQVFTSVADFAETPALIAGGLSKAIAAPGWRMGWMLKHDLVGALNQVWDGCLSLATLINGPNTLIQAAMPKILSNAETKEYRQQLSKTIGEQSALCYELLMKAEGLHPVKSYGAMYTLVQLQCEKFHPSWGISNDVQFAAALMKEENVQVLPGTIFGIPGFFRIVVTKPPEQLKEAIERIDAFDTLLKAPKKK